MYHPTELVYFTASHFANFLTKCHRRIPSIFGFLIVTTWGFLLWRESIWGIYKFQSPPCCSQPAHTLLTWAALVAPLEGVHVEHVHAVLHAPMLPGRMLTHLSMQCWSWFLTPSLMLNSDVADADSDAYTVPSHHSSHPTVVEELGVEVHSTSSLGKITF